MYVIRHIEGGEWVKRFGDAHSYTRKLQEAQRFDTREAAQAHCCGNERVQSVEAAFGW